MAELHSNIYYKHNKIEVMKKLDSLFYESEGDASKMKDIAKSLNSERGEALIQDLIDFVDEPTYELDAESLEKLESYSVGHFVHGSRGDEIIEAIIDFLYKLLPDIHAQAWGCGDDDPWEFWFKFENGSIVRRDDEPLMDQDEDKVIKEQIYEWWHSDMPDAIKEGFLNEE